jgi:two-component system sensor histidine kinase SenX3
MEEFASPRLRLDVSVEAPPVRADRDALALAVRNLVDNAIKYSPASFDVNISVEARAGRAGIAVSDSGAGISPEEQREVLGKFVRGSAAKTLNVKGTGIGLAMVDQVAKAHGGRLDVESELGRGSRFTLWIPVSEQHS